MDNDKDYKISTRPVSGRKLVSELDTSTGISYNGTTHSEPDKSKATDKVRLRKFFLKES
jgi:hypothetical protein